MKRITKTLFMLIAHSAARMVRRPQPSFKKFAKDSRENYLVREYEITYKGH